MKIKKNTINRIAKVFTFLLIVCSLFNILSRIVERKTHNGPWNYMAKMNEFYNLEENQLDYICVGSSHAYCTVNPLAIWKESKVKGFVLATQQQPLKASYHYIIEAFKKQTPQIVLLEGYMVFSTDTTEAVLYDAIDPLHFSLNKIKMINSLVEPSQREQYYFNIIKYHSRWKEITLQDIYAAFHEPQDIYKGFVALNDATKSTNMIPKYENICEVEIPEENLKTLKDIKKYVEGKGSKLIILIAPYDITNEVIAGTIKAEKRWAENNGIEVIDIALMLEELDIDPATDYYDSTHLNISGATKVGKYLAKYFEKFNIEENTIQDIKWKNDLEMYEKTYH